MSTAWLVALTTEEWTKPVKDRTSLIERIAKLSGVQIAERGKRMVAVVCEDSRARAQLEAAVADVATVHPYEGAEPLVVNTAHTHADS